jgi:hypothetical protein
VAGEPTIASNLARDWWLTDAAASHRLATFASCAADTSHRIALLDGFLCDPLPGEPPGSKLVCWTCFGEKHYQPWTGSPELTARYQSASKTPTPLRSLVIVSCAVIGGFLGFLLNKILPMPMGGFRMASSGDLDDSHPLLATGGLDAVIVGAFAGYFFGAGCAGTFGLWSGRPTTGRRPSKLWGAIRWFISASLFTFVFTASLSVATRTARGVLEALPNFHGLWKSLALYCLFGALGVAHLFAFIGALLAGRKIRDRVTPRHAAGEGQKAV